MPKAWTSFRARVRWPPRCLPPSTPGSCCCVTTGRGSWTRCWNSRSATPGTATPCSAGLEPPLRRCPRCSRRIGPPRPSCGCPAEGSLPKVSWCGTRRTPGLWNGLWRQGLRHRPARQELMRPGASGGRASWPAPWWIRFRPRTGIPRALIIAGCWPWRIWRASRPGTRRPPPWSSGATRSPRPGLGARARRCCRPLPSCPGSRTATLIRPLNWARTPSWRRRSSRSRTGRRTTATRTCRWTTCCRRNTAPAAGP